ncbi:hypothetical protein FHP29_03780 [Nocardioides albidus]|uniref:Uncharacterized protein n=1 Tax=Nocardioides albidus TaxID=1517589 RepID=A0A5C4WCW2_9ACTN|nr:hypothetical protein FHP29_03780 [Nocardioides albidus]
MPSRRGRSRQPPSTSAHRARSHPRGGRGPRPAGRRPGRGHARPPHPTARRPGPFRARPPHRYRNAARPPRPCARLQPSQGRTATQPQPRAARAAPTRPRWRRTAAGPRTPPPPRSGRA